MKIEIWSDVVCPFCYIGKRKLESALSHIKEINNLEIVWKSFLLDPDLVSDEKLNLNQYLVTHKGISMERAISLNNYVTEMASEVGLTFNLDKAKVANSINAHRLLHLAKKYHKQSEVKEKLFSAYFTEGKNIDDLAILVEIIGEVGLDRGEISTTIKEQLFTDEIKLDLYEARQMSISGVPFFLFNHQLSISGAQSNTVFVDMLKSLLTHD